MGILPTSSMQYYKMLLVEARENRLTLHNMENVDLFNLFQIILDKDRSLDETKEKAIKYCDEHNVSRNVIMTVAGATGSNIDYDAIGQEVKLCVLYLIPLQKRMKQKVLLKQGLSLVFQKMTSLKGCRTN